MKIVRPGDPGYDKDRVICNARFDYRPWAIYYCQNAVASGAPEAGGVRVREIMSR